MDSGNFILLIKHVLQRETDGDASESALLKCIELCCGSVTLRIQRPADGTPSGDRVKSSDTKTKSWTCHISMES